MREGRRINYNLPSEKTSSAWTLYFDFTIDYAQTLAFRRANGDYLREGQWKDFTIEVYII